MKNRSETTSQVKWLQKTKASHEMSGNQSLFALKSGWWYGGLPMTFEFDDFEL